MRLRKPKKSEVLQYQVAAYVNARRYKTPEARERARDKAMRQFLRTGRQTVPGVKLVARWRNPDNRNWRHANWKTTEQPGQSLYDFWGTLHGQRGALHALAERYL
jgi:hypothetical protein